MFDWFKKKNEEEFDPTDIRLDQIRKNFFLDYNFISYQVKKEYEYEWEDGTSAKEFQLKSSSDTIYLYIEEDDELYLEISKAEDINKLNRLVLNSFKESDNPVPEINFLDKTYYFSTDTAGRLYDTNDDYDEFLEFKYVSNDGEILYIEQWDDDEFELSLAKKVNEQDFTQILPG